MQVPNIFIHKKTVIIEVLVLLAFMGGVYYFYTNFSEKSATTTVSHNEQLLGQNFIVLLKAINQDKISFVQKSFLNSSLVNQLQDFSEVILPTDSRGRAEPFSSYASPGSIR